MSVIVELSVPAEEFHLGRLLGMDGGTRVVLESVVPLGTRSVPFIRVFEARESFESSVGADPSVEDIHVVSSHDDETLYALDWNGTDDVFFEGVMEHGGTVLEATGAESTWSFELRFEQHEHLSAFQAHCREEGIPVDFQRLFNPTKPDAGPWYGLTPAQRTALLRAVDDGYYSIPREITTKELAGSFGISDQAMTERLRRGVTNLVTNTIQVSEEVAKQL